MRARKLTILLLLMWLCVPTFAAEWTLRLDGIGPLRIGMRFDEVNYRMDGVLHRSDPALQPTPSCDQLALPTHPGVWLMFIDDVLKRIDVGEAGTETEYGVSVGDPVSHVALAYPKVVQEKHFYDDSEQYLTVQSKDTRLAVRFETYHGKIEHFYAGAIEQVRYVEGCL